MNNKKKIDISSGIEWLKVMPVCVAYEQFSNYECQYLLFGTRMEFRIIIACNKVMNYVHLCVAKFRSLLHGNVSKVG